MPAVKRPPGGVVGARWVKASKMEARPAGHGTDSDGWVPLFNGKDLTGWTTHALAPAGDDWRVEDGALVGRAGGPTAFLSSRTSRTSGSCWRGSPKGTTS